jgi:uncharacterized protein
MRALAAVVAAFLILAARASAQSPDIVISQVYGGGGNSGSTLTNDFIELFNRGATTVPVEGWSVQYASSGGSSWQRTNLTGSIEPGQYYLVQEGQGAGGTTPLPDADASGSIAMAATAGKVALLTNTTLLTCGNATAGLCAGNPAIRDFVGYGSAASESETAPTHTLSNTTAALRGQSGCVDTDDNSADFTEGTPTPRNTASPRGDCGAPAVSGTSPAGGAVGVAPDANISISFSEPVDVADGAVTVACEQSGAHAVSQSGGPETYTFDPASDFTPNEQCTVTVDAAGVTDDGGSPMSADFIFSFVAGIPGLRIRDIQGAHHLSPHDGDAVAEVPGVITGRHADGFWFQDATSDGDERTSEGVFVFTGSGSRPDVPVGMSVEVSGRADEFRPGSATGNNLTITEIVSASWTIGAPGTVRPTVLGIGGRIAPVFTIDDDAVGGSAENPATPFDPRHDGLDFHESVEGMLVRVNNPLAVGPTNNFDELPVVADFGLLAFPHTRRGGVFVRPGDFNPERIILDAEAGFDTPDAHVRDRLGSVEAIGHYSFGAFKYNVTSTPDVTSGGLEREVTQSPGKQELAVGSMNVENLDPGDLPATIAALADILVHNMKAPDIVALEEVQDNNGATNNGVVAADQTYATFIAAIARAGGPEYEFRQIDPVNNQDGGQPGGNIRVGFLFRTDRGLEFVDRPGGDAITPVEVVDTPGGPQLSISPGRIDPANPAWEASRKPLAGEFRWNGRTVIAVANHFNSKGGDDPLFGRFQPPNRVTEPQRHEQATAVADFVGDVLDADRNANVIVMGDLNDFEFSETLDILEDGGLINLMETLPARERYSYVFEGNSQTLDQILVSKALTSPKPEYDSVHVNAEFHDQASDHDPQVARLEVTGRGR